MTNPGCKVARGCKIKILKDYKTLKKGDYYLCIGFGGVKGKQYRILKQLKTLEQKRIDVFNETLNKLSEEEYFITVSNV